MNRSPVTPASATRPSRVFPIWLALLGVLACVAPSLCAQTFSENFNSGAANGWTATGNWTVPSGTGVYKSADTSVGPQISTYTGQKWTTNFILQARVKLWGTATGNRVGLVYSYQPAQGANPFKYYAVMLQKATSGPLLQFFEKITSAGDPVAVQSHWYPVPTSGAPDESWVTLRIVRVGTLTTVTVSSSTGSATFKRHQALISGEGEIGVIDRSASGEVDDIVVGPVPQPGITEPFGSGPDHYLLANPTQIRYVDPDFGNDTWTGTSETAAWRTVPGMPGGNHPTDPNTGKNLHEPLPGQVIALKRGGVWRLGSTWNVLSSGSPGQPVIYTAYGSGPLPKITVLEDLSSGWSPAGGSHNTHVYQKTLPAGMTIERLYIDDEGMGEAYSDTPAAENWVGQPRKVETQLAPSPNPNGVVVGSMHDTGITKYWRQNGTTLYLYSPPENPTIGKRIEGLKASIVNGIKILNRSHVTLDRLEVHGGATEVIRLEANGSQTPTNVRVTNCIVRAARVRGIFVIGYTTGLGGFSNGVIKWNRVYSGEGPTTRASPNGADYARHPSSGTIDARLLYYSEENQLGSNDGISLWNHVRGWVVAQNEVSNFWHTQLKISVQGTTYKASEADNSAFNNVLEHNEAHAGNINYAHGLEINAGNDTAAEAGLMLGNIARYNYIYNTWVNSKHEGRDTLFYGNIIVGVNGSPRYPTGNNGWSGDGVVVQGHGGSSGGIFAYNTVVDTGGAALALTSRTPPPGLVIANNLFSHSGNRLANSSGTKYSALRDQNYPTANVDLDNNLFFGAQMSTVYEYKSSSTGGQTWGPASLMLTNNTNWNDNIGDDPRFTNHGSADLTLLDTSPARNVAKDVSSQLPDSILWKDLGALQGWETRPCVTGQTLSANTHNDYPGWKGMKITVGAQPIVVTDLGRWVTTGNSGSHELRILSDTGATLGSTTVATAGLSGEQFAYSALTSPVKLNAGTVYHIMSREFSGGDRWRGYSTSLNHTGVVAVNAAVRALDVTGSLTIEVDSSNPNSCSGPVTFKYYTEEGPVAAGHTLSANSHNDFGGLSGMKITVGSTPIVLTDLGRWVLAGNTQAHIVRVLNAAGATLGSVSITTSGAQAGKMKYAPLATPVPLAANTTYYIASEENIGGDTWWGSNTTLSHNPAVVTINGAVRSTNGGGTWTPTTPVVGTCYGPVGFRYF